MTAYYLFAHCVALTEAGWSAADFPASHLVLLALAFPALTCAACLPARECSCAPSAQCANVVASFYRFVCVGGA